MILIWFALVATVAGATGWFLGRMFQSRNYVGFSSPIRKGGTGLVNPLLVCARDDVSSINNGVQAVIQKAVNAEIEKGDITASSVYYRRFLDNSWALLNGDETYYPASLNKVPLMIAYYNWVEETDAPLTKNIYFPSGYDDNLQQEVQPQHPILPGRSYTAAELIDAMIKDSDNNATLLLFSSIDQNALGKVFGDLHVPFLAPGQSPVNYMNVSSYAFFFRVLYNGTYLSHADSERVLDLLSQTTFNDGLVAGVPAGITVAHKFGLVSVAPNNTVVTARELHDCGIVYATNQNPYLLCVMTKSTGTLQGAERAIANVSRAVYQYITK